jgi:hypothetical protein
LADLLNLDRDNPTGCADTSFYEACAAHDRCYQDCGNNKESCDSDLLGDGASDPPTGMLGVCVMSSCAYRCSELAYAYYYGVSGYGDTAWQEDKVKACDCSNNNCP